MLGTIRTGRLLVPILLLVCAACGDGEEPVDVGASDGASASGVLTVYSGRDEVRRGIDEVFATFPDARWSRPTHFVAGNRGVTEWVFTATGPSGEAIETQGCDVFTFRDGRIAVKNSYRKLRTG